MKTFNFTIKVNFFHDQLSKEAVLKNFTYPEAFSVFSDLKQKYSCSRFNFHEIVMFCDDVADERTVSRRVVNYICNEFIDFDDEPGF